MGSLVVFCMDRTVGEYASAKGLEPAISMARISAH